MPLFLVLIACRPDPAQPPDVPSPRDGCFDVLTYNVHGLPDALTNTERPVAERMERIAPLLAPYDVVGLQEDFDEGNHGLLIGELESPLHWFEARLDDTRAYGSGLALGAVIGTESSYDEEHYTRCSGVLDGASDCLASKGFQVLGLDLGDGAVLDLYNTHHEAGGGADDDNARASQVSQVLASMAGRSAGHALLYMGDTNLRPSDPEDAVELARYADIGLRDACDETACPEPDHIDRFLLRDSADLTLSVDSWWVDESFVDEDGRPLSDHPAVASRICWQR